MLCTQMLVESDPEGEEEVEERQIGWLEVEGIKYRINQGENKIGRDPSCSIVLQKSSLSRTHAIIEGDVDGSTIHDVGSSNGTKKGNIILRRNVRYNLCDGEEIMLGDVSSVWRIYNQDQTFKVDETGSVGSQGSVSLLDLQADQDIHEAPDPGEENEDQKTDNQENLPPNFVPDTPAV